MRRRVLPISAENRNTKIISSWLFSSRLPRIITQQSQWTAQLHMVGTGRGAPELSGGDRTNARFQATFLTEGICTMTIGKIVVWLIVGALAGTLAGRVMTLSKRGFGFWTNMAVGMVGALVGGFLFWLFHINLHLAEIKITFEDLISAFVGSLLCIIVWRLIRRATEKKHGTE